MRKELDRMEEIERYLGHELSEDERQEFDARLEHQSDLAEDLQLQELLHGAIQRRAIRLTTRKAYTSYKWYGGGLLKGIGLLVIGIAVAVVFFVDDVETDSQQDREQNIELHEDPAKPASTDTSSDPQ